MVVDVILTYSGSLTDVDLNNAEQLITDLKALHDGTTYFVESVSFHIPRDDPNISNRVNVVVHSLSTVSTINTDVTAFGTELDTMVYNFETDATAYEDAVQFFGVG